MAKAVADASEIQLLGALAAAPNKAQTTGTAYYDMLAHGLTTADICDALLDWIAEGKPIKKTVMRGKDAGKPGFEIWPEFSGRTFYCKYVIRQKPSGERLIVVSAHLDQ